MSRARKLDRLTGLDNSLFRFINSQAGKSATLDRGVAFLAEHSPDLFYLYFLLAWYGADPESIEFRQDLIASLASGVASVGIATIVSKAINRERPFSHSDEVTPLIDHRPGHSFPSRHVAGSVGFATGLGTNVGAVETLFFTTAFIVTVSRAYIGVHWPSDLLGGAIIGLAVGKTLHPHISERLARLATRLTLAG